MNFLLISVANRNRGRNYGMLQIQKGWSRCVWGKAVRCR